MERQLLLTFVDNWFSAWCMLLDTEGETWEELDGEHALLRIIVNGGMN